MVWLVGALLLLWFAWGPLVLLVAAAALCVPRVRWWVLDRTYVSRRVAAWAAGACVALVAIVIVLPDGWLPVPPAPGALVGPAYVGRPATPRQLVTDVASNPHLAPDSSANPGPLGLQPEVETAWLGLQRCGRLEATSLSVLVALCSDRSGPVLRLVDAETMRPTTTQDLPDAADSSCTGDTFYLDAADRAVVATTDRRVLAVHTRSADGEPGLGTDTTWDLKPYVPYGDCLVALAPDWAGRIWWASQEGLVGTIAPGSGQVRVVDLDEEVRHGLTADEAGGVYVVTDEALHRLTAGPDGTPQPAWRTAYDGTSGSAPVLLDGGMVADHRHRRLPAGGAVRGARRGCGGLPAARLRQGRRSHSSPLVPLGTGVVVTNNDGYSSPRSTMLGFTTSHGIARVDVVEGACVERWTSDAVSPGSGVTASLPTGLLYAWTKRPSLLGVSAWYLTGLDAGTGRSMWSVRTGTGMLAGSDHSQVALGPDGSAWLGTAAGLVRVRDRE